MKRIEGQTLERQTIVLEEVHLINCVLRDCDLFYSGGFYVWEQTSFDGCRLRLRDAAKNSEGLFRHFGMLKDQPSPTIQVKSSTKAVN